MGVLESHKNKHMTGLMTVEMNWVQIWKVVDIKIVTGFGGEALHSGSKLSQLPRPLFTSPLTLLTKVMKRRIDLKLPAPQVDQLPVGIRQSLLKVHLAKMIASRSSSMASIAFASRVMA
ncbi:hypothetical protein ACLOJK_030061 [Asimina triloba]